MIGKIPSDVPSQHPGLNCFGSPARRLGLRTNLSACGNSDPFLNFAAERVISANHPATPTLIPFVFFAAFGRILRLPLQRLLSLRRGFFLSFVAKLFPFG
jgi:hypothetical protein